MESGQTLCANEMKYERLVGPGSVPLALPAESPDVFSLIATVLYLGSLTLEVSSSESSAAQDGEL